MPTTATAKQPLHLRVFLGSPGDVNDERQLALKVLNQLPYDPLLRGRVTFEAVAWDHPQSGAAMWAGISAQESVIRSLGKPADCDIVVICLWSRLGSPIAQPDYAKPDGGFYTGTEWEYHNAVLAFEASGRQRPPVLVYHRVDEPVCKVSPKQKQAYLDQLANVEQVDNFLQACRTRDGSIPNDYNIPSDFEEALRQHLKDIVRQRLDSLATQPAQTDSVSKPKSVSNHDPIWTGSPFLGLRPFTNKDSLIFFGRGRETDELLARLRDPKHRFIAVVGASGSGKSSLVWAGLIPRLLGGALQGSADWAWVRFTPGELGDNPFISLAACWKTALESVGQTAREFADELLLAPGRLDGLVRLVLANRPDSAELLLFIDQFEELFTVVKDDCRQAFVRFVLAASGSSKVRVIVSVRADFYAQCVEHGLADVLRTGSYPLAAPGLGALQQMVIRPAALAGLAFEQGLDETILGDAGKEPGALPLLAFALERLYQKRTAAGLLTYAAYEESGKVQGSIGQHADAVFAKLAPEVQATFTEVFRELVEVDERGEPTRRRAKLSELTTGSSRHTGRDRRYPDCRDASEPFRPWSLGSGGPCRNDGEPLNLNALTLINALTKARLLVTDKREDDDTATIEVAHEALFRSWGKLADWVTQTADDHRLRRQITQLAAYWDAHQRRDEHRWPDERIVEVAQMLAHLGLRLEQFPAMEQEFLGPVDPADMLQAIELPKTSHERRAMIGVRLDRLGDPRKGVGLREDGLPDMDWMPIQGGEVTIEIRADVNKPDSEIIKTLTREVGAFQLARYPVTLAQFQAFVRECHDGQQWRLPPGLPFNLPDSYSPPKHRARHGNHPADSVNWYDAVSFCHWLSERLGFEVRLPTEFEWQLAAIGGINRHSGMDRRNPDCRDATDPSPPWSLGSGDPCRNDGKNPDSPPPKTYPWGQDWNPAEEPWRTNSYESDLGRATAVGMYPGGASALGVLDLSGTLWEWCLNTYDDPNDVTVSTAGAARVVRGGSWDFHAWNCRSAYRNYVVPVGRDYGTGFRCARVQS